MDTNSATPVFLSVIIVVAILIQTVLAWHMRKYAAKQTRLSEATFLHKKAMDLFQTSNYIVDMFSDACAKHDLERQEHIKRLLEALRQPLPDPAAQNALLDQLRTNFEHFLAQPSPLQHPLWAALEQIPQTISDMSELQQPMEQIQSLDSAPKTIYRRISALIRWAYEGKKAGMSNKHLHALLESVWSTDDTNE